MQSISPALQSTVYCRWVWPQTAHWSYANGGKMTGIMTAFAIVIFAITVIMCLSILKDMRQSQEQTAAKKTAGLEKKGKEKHWEQEELSELEQYKRTHGY